MNTLKLTKKDFKETENYWIEYIGKTDVSNYDGHIEIEGGSNCLQKPHNIHRNRLKTLAFYY